jgi:hypothetical protein
LKNSAKYKDLALFPSDHDPHSRDHCQGENRLEVNLKAVRSRWPRLAALVDRAPAFEECRVTDTPEPTLSIDGIQLGSGYDRRSEAAIQASLVPADSSLAWVYGIGSGDLPRTLLQRESLRWLEVVILNPAVLQASFRFFDHRDWLEDARVNLLTAPEAGDLQRPFAAVPSCLQLADDGAARLRDLVFLELSTPFIREKHGAGNASLIARLEENRDYCRSDGDAGSLFGLHRGERILVAAAGPTLAESFDWIRTRKDRHPLVAVDSALKPLAAAGIVPDAVVAVDPHPEDVLKQFAGFDLAPFSATPLVYFPCVHREVLDLWPGPRLTAYPDHPLFRSLAKRYPKQALFSSGSVLHPAVDLAVGMGAAEIVLLGADFAYPGGFSHVSGAAHARSMVPDIQGHWVHDGSGRRIPTSPNLRGFLRDLEGYIQEHPGVRFANAGRKGARIEGAPYLELSS